MFVGDFGGTMGLWLGASILATVQLLDYLIMLCLIKCGKNKKVVASQQIQVTAIDAKANLA